MAAVVKRCPGEAPQEKDQMSDNIYKTENNYGCNYF